MILKERGAVAPYQSSSEKKKKRVGKFGRAKFKDAHSKKKTIIPNWPRNVKKIMKQDHKKKIIKGQRHFKYEQG